MPDDTRTVLITGAGSGIGAATARRIAAPGTRLLLHTRRNREGLVATAATAREAGAEVETILGDLTDPETPAMLVAESAKRFGGLDQVVANAGAADRRVFGGVAEGTRRLDEPIQGAQRHAIIEQDRGIRPADRQGARQKRQRGGVQPAVAQRDGVQPAVAQRDAEKMECTGIVGRLLEEIAAQPRRPGQITGRVQGPRGGERVIALFRRDEFRQAAPLPRVGAKPVAPRPTIIKSYHVIENERAEVEKWTR
ncbi:MAG: SDR family NAD(P)-dependent oxidoreductase [Acetobacterales bacterium]